MTNETLKRILEEIDLDSDDCVPMIDNYIHYVDGVFAVPDMYGREFRCRYEFLVIAENNVKQGIILRCGYGDLHWLVLEQWRGKHVISNALRSGILAKVWPENKTITCCFEEGDDLDGCQTLEEKIQITKHLAKIANLEIVEDSGLF